MITDDTLILYFYADGLSDAERQDVRGALEQDVGLRNRYTALTRDLRELGETVSVEAPASSVARWRVALDEEIDAGGRQGMLGWFRRRGFVLAAAMSFVFAIGLFLGVRLSEEPPILPPGSPVIATSPENSESNIVASTPAPPRPPATFVRGVAVHLENTQIRLASVNFDNPQERSDLISQIVSQNRFFLKAADENGAEDVARLLRAFEPLLLAMSEQDGDAVAAERVREQLDFEMGVTLTKFARQTSNKTNEF